MRIQGRDISIGNYRQVIECYIRHNNDVDRGVLPTHLNSFSHGELQIELSEPELGEVAALPKGAYQEIRLIFHIYTKPI